MLISCGEVGTLPTGPEQTRTSESGADTVQPAPTCAVFALFLHSKCQSELHFA